jgi:hypothetical protein
MSRLHALYRRLPLVRELDRLLARTERADAASRDELRALRSAFARDFAARLRDEKAAREGPLSLHRFEHAVCSQQGEDGVLLEIFRRIGEGARTFVEVGIGDGVENNTAFLHSLGWTGAWIDAQPLPVAPPPGLRFHRSFVTRETIAALFTELAIPLEVDLCSLDIDQNTYYVWEALVAWRPRVVVVEYNAALPPTVDWKVTYDGARVWDGTINFGASLKAYEILGRRLGYALVHCEISGANAFFVRADLAGDLFLGPFDAETHYEPPRYSLDQTPGHRRARLDRLTAR